MLVGPAGCLRCVYEQLAQLAALKALPLIDAAIAIGVLFGANQHALVVELVAVGHAVALGRDVDAHLVAALHDPGVLDAVGYARCAKTIELAVGAVVLPAVDDAVSVAVRFDANGAAVLEIGAHVDVTVAIGVVIEALDRASGIINGCHAFAFAGGHRKREDQKRVQLRPLTYRTSDVIAFTHGTQEDFGRLIVSQQVGLDLPNM